MITITLQYTIAFVVQHPLISQVKKIRLPSSEKTLSSRLIAISFCSKNIFGEFWAVKHLQNPLLENTQTAVLIFEIYLGQFDLSMLCILTSLWVLHAPQSWSKHFFQNCFCNFVLIFKSGNKTLDKRYGANLKKSFLLNFAANLLLFWACLKRRHVYMAVWQRGHGNTCGCSNRRRHW